MLLQSIRRTFRYAIRPTPTQSEALHHHVDEACRLYNGALQERRDAWKLARTSISFFSQDVQLKGIRADGSLDIPNFGAARDILRRVDRAFAGFFRRMKVGEKAGYPRFRSRHRYDSITFPHYGNGCRLRENGCLYLQGVGEVKIILHRPIEGTVKTLTIKREGGRWFALFSVICDTHPLPESRESVGIDVGLTTFATCSDGSEIANPRFLRNGQRKLRIAQRRVARRKKGSRSRRKAVRLLQRAHSHVRNQRNDFHHKTARALINRYGLIAVEDLNLKGLAGGMLAKPVHDAAWGNFLLRLEEKAECAARRVVRVNPRGTTQVCSGCGMVVHKTLAERQHRCFSCGLSLGRDLNAALNILRLGLGASLDALTREVTPCVASEIRNYGS